MLKMFGKKIKCKTVGDYHDFFFKSDLLILPDVFENFRKINKQYYNLDSIHYLSCPGSVWDATFKMSGINLELFTDINTNQIVEKGKRGGISYTANSYSKPNNKYICGYDKDKESTYLMNWDVNNLYGWAMSQPQLAGLNG